MRRIQTPLLCMKTPLKDLEHITFMASLSVFCKEAGVFLL